MSNFKCFRAWRKCVQLLALIIITTSPSLARDKYETITAQGFGTGTQTGQNFSVTVQIYEYSADADQQLLVDAFNKGKDQGLVNALTKMKAVGRISITGTLGYDLSYIRMTPTPTGRRIRFITNRQIRFGEAYADGQSLDYNLTAGEIIVDDQDKKKSTGTLYPAAELKLNKEGHLEWDLTQNPWKLVDVLDWKGTPGQN